MNGKHIRICSIAWGRMKAPEVLFAMAWGHLKAEAWDHLKTDVHRLRGGLDL